MFLLIKLIFHEKPIEAKDIILFYFSPYSPDLNPIETEFSKMQSVLRKAAARTVDFL
ncbi:MAG: transposase [Sodalis sp. (in: enterobacteria)]